MKKILTFLFLLIFLSGCSGKNSNKTVIQFASWGSQSEIEILKPILADFEAQNPDIKVDFIHIPQNYFQKIHLLFASNMAPDVIFINNLYLPFYAKAGVLEELKPSKDFYKNSLKALSYNGKLYAIPRDVSNMVIFYNKDLFKKYGVPYPQNNWDMQDFLETAQKLTHDTNNDGQTDIFGISFDESPSLFYLPYLMNYGGGILSDDTKSLIINSPESQNGLQFYSDLRNKYHVAPTNSQSASATMAQLFLQGKLAMQVSGRWLVPKYSTDAKFNWSVINFPKGIQGHIVPLDASGWSISSGSKHKAEAKHLVAFLSSEQSIAKFAKSGLIVPARIDVAQGEFLSHTQDKNSPYSNLTQINKVFVNVIKTAKPTPVSVDYNEIQDKIDKQTNYLFNQ